MGKVRLKGDVSLKEYHILEEISGEIKVKNATDGVDLLKANSTTITDAGGVALNAHASRHAYGGADALPSGSINVSQLASETIRFYIYIPIPDSPQTGLAADSTGVKWTSRFKFKWSKARLKAVRIRATWTATAGDSVSEMRVIDETTGATIVSVSGNTGTDAEAESTDLTNVTDGGLFHVESAVTTASATAGATYDITYIVVELRYGAS